MIKPQAVCECEKEFVTRKYETMQRTGRPSPQALCITFLISILNFILNKFSIKKKSDSHISKEIGLHCRINNRLVVTKVTVYTDHMNSFILISRKQFKSSERPFCVFYH